MAFDKTQDFSSHTDDVSAWGWYEDRDLITGGQGDDTLNGARGNDEIHGGDGGDQIDDSAITWVGLLSLYGPVRESGPGLDIAHAIEGERAADQDEKTDVFPLAVATYHEGGDDHYFGDGGDDHISGRSGDDVLDGGADNDFIWGGTGKDTLIGGSGDDDLFGNSGNDTLLGGSGTDILLGGTGADLMEGGTGADIIEGGDIAASTYDGLVAARYLTQAQANQLLAAANAGDTVSYSESLSGVNVDFERATQTGGDAEGDTITGVENINGSRSNDTLRGDDKANVMFGGLGNDTLEGRGGADTLIGDGNSDTSSYESSSLGVDVDLIRGTGLGGDAAGDTLQSIENLRGSALGDRLRGDDALSGNRLEGGGGDDVLEGRGGNDRLFGGDGRDTLDGGTDDDLLNGGLGNDILRGGGGTDTVDLEAWDTPAPSNGISFFATQVTVRLGLNGADGSATNSFLFGGGVIETDTLSSIENVSGSNNNDVFFGNEQDNTFDGRLGDDVFHTDLGRDTYNGSFGIDTVDYTGSSAVTVSIDSSIRGVGGFSEGDLLFGIENVIGTNGNDSITGNAVDNRLSGGRGEDTLNGGAGKDTLSGGIGAGRDILIGGADADTFLFQSFEDSRIINGGVQDIIQDFAVGQDKLDFRALHVSAADVIIRANGASAASVGIDTNGNHTFDEGEFAISVNIANGHALTLNDFLL